MAKTKREIDKEQMYKKLMPSNGKAAKELSDEEVKPGDTLRELQNPPRTTVLRDVGIPLMDNQPTVLVNLMESIVMEKFDSVIAKFRCCKCDRCKKDIVALALNKLPPKYMVIQKGQLLPDIDREISSQVLTAMIQSVLQVRAHPRH